MVDENALLEELKYIRGRVDQVYGAIDTQNQRVTAIETKVDGHLNSHWKFISASMAIVAVVVGAVATAIVSRII